MTFGLGTGLFKSNTLSMGGGFPIATPTIAVVDADENGISDTNPPGYTLGITTIGDKAVVENDWWEIREDGDTDSGNWITGQFSAADIIAGSDSATGNTLTAAAHYAQARIRRGDGSPGTIYSAWSAIDTFTAPAAVPSQAAIIAISNYGFWSTENLSTLYQDTSPATTNVSADGQTVAQWNDISGNSRHLTQATGTFEPEYDETASIRSLFHDGVDDTLQYTFVSAPTDCSLFFAIKTTDNGFVVFSDTGTKYLLVATSGDTTNPTDASAGTVSYYVDGALVTKTPAALHTAIADGNWHVVEIRNVNFSSWGGFRTYYAGAASGRMTGNLAEILIKSSPTAQNRTDILAYINDRMGL